MWVHLKEGAAKPVVTQHTWVLPATPGPPSSEEAGLTLCQRRVALLLGEGSSPGLS